jgi:proton-translocating NADH-quinone oxidoreductase chain M
LTTPFTGFVGRRFGRERIITATYVASALVFSLMSIFMVYPEVLQDSSVMVMSGSPLLPGGVFLEVNTLSIFVAVIYLIIGAAAAFFSFHEIKTGSITGYYTILMGMITGLVGIAFSGDLFTLFIFWEIMCLSSYTLVAFKKKLWESIEASYKYLIMSSAGCTTILFALSFLYGLTGTLNISYLSVSLGGTVADPMAYLALIMLLVGFGLQAGLVPFHTWLPDAHMAAPSAVSAVLSGIMVKAGIFGLIRVLLTIFAPMYGAWHITLATFAVLTMFVGNLSALLQDDIKRLLAFSTIANSGYILMGLAIGTHSAIMGSLFHVLNHGITKALLFLCVGVFISKANTRSLKELAGIGHTMPITSTLFIIGTLALASIPPLNIFWSELLIITACLEAGALSLSFLMIINLVFSAAYCLRVIQTVAVKKETATAKKVSEASINTLIPILALACLLILIGIYPSPFQKFAETAAKATLG